jgi:hypothetical protein
VRKMVLALRAGRICFDLDRDHEIKLMKALNVWRVEEGAVRRLPVLVRQAIGCTASDKEH